MIMASENNVLVPPLSELIIGFIAFGVFCFVLMKYAWPMFEKTFEARRQAIEGGIARAEQAQAEAQEALRRYQAQLADARNEAARIRDEALRQGQQILGDLRGRAVEEHDRIVARGEEVLTSERESLVAQLRVEIGRLAVELSEKILEQRLADDANVQATVDRFLDDLESGAESVGAGGLSPAPAAPGTGGQPAGPAAPAGGGQGA